MVNEIMLIELRNNCKMIFVRVGLEFILFDMDISKLRSFTLPTTQRILRSTYLTNVDNLRYLMLYSTKGDVITYRLENIMKYFFLKLKEIKKAKLSFHPFVEVEMFKMIFVHDNFLLQDRILWYSYYFIWQLFFKRVW